MLEPKELLEQRKEENVISNIIKLMSIFHFLNHSLTLSANCQQQ